LTDAVIARVSALTATTSVNVPPTSIPIRTLGVDAHHQGDQVHVHVVVLFVFGEQVVDLGVLTLSKVVPNSLEVQKKLLFLPTNLTPGIELSDDPLPSVRSAAYGVSFGRRSQ